MFKNYCTLLTYRNELSKRLTSEFKIVKTIEDYLDITYTEATAFFSKHKLSNKDEAQLSENIEFFKEVGYDRCDILNNPRLLKINPQILEQRHAVLKQGGFVHISPKVLLNFRANSYKKISILKLEGLIKESTNVTDSFKSHLYPIPDNLDVNHLGDDRPWVDIHINVLKRYLMWRLEANYEEIERLFRIYKMIHNKSLEYLCQNILLAEDLGFTPRDLLRFGYVLHAYPKYPLTVLSEMPNLAGADMRKAMKTFPKLIMISPQNFRVIYKILKENEIPDESISTAMNIFTCSPVTVKVRLEEIREVPDLRVHFHNPKILSLVIYHNRARTRLAILKKLQLNCSGFSVLGSGAESFEVHVREGRDMMKSHEVYKYVHNLMGGDSEAIEKDLKRHPLFMQVSLMRIEETYNHLKQLNFSDQSILSAIQILLYPRVKIEQAFEKIKNNENFKDKNFAQTQKLQLMLYYIEKEHHFNGHGIWT